MTRFGSKQRSLNACLIAAIVHLCFAILLTFFYYSHLSNEMDDVVGLDFVNMEVAERKQRTIKRVPKKTRSENPKAITEFRPQYKALSASANPIDETVRQAEKKLMHSATETVTDSATELPEVTTQARNLNSRASSIPNLSKVHLKLPLDKV